MRPPRLIVLLAVLLALAATPVAPSVAAPSRVNLPVGTGVDYQLGGDASVPAGVGIVERDRTSRPLGGHYNICYVNGFQAQADEQSFWARHPRLILRRHGRRVVDSAWGEWLLDVRTPTKRKRLARIVGAWTQGCRTKGFDAVEYDNLDSFTRSHGLIKRHQAVSYARLLVARAHAVGLAAGQKNLAGFDGRGVGYDFAIAEECGRYRECGEYTKFYGRRVIAVEYRRTDFDWTCTHYGASLPVELRDLDLTPGGTRDWC